MLQGVQPDLIFRIPPWVAGASLGLAAVMAVGALWAYGAGHRRIREVATALAAGLVILTPVMFHRQRIKVYPTRIEHFQGFAPHRHDTGFRFAEVDSVLVTKEWGRRGHRNTWWTVWFRDGGTYKFTPSLLWSWHTREIIAYLRGRGVRVTDKR
ncbi:MAG TPA: hypothetical protein VLA95_05695 [Gemmatimonadales bacterium]|nr:hypothetical protein [Gemmatimonadales bacterium]